MTRRGVAGVRLCHASPCKYPAGKCPLHGLPTMGEPIDWSKASHPPIFVGNCCDDMNACLCGYAVCSCPAKPQPYKLSVRDVDEPPKDALPEGWTEVAAYPSGCVVKHASGFVVSTNYKHWFWAPSGHYQWHDAKYETRELAMAAALQSVGPKEEEYCCEKAKYLYTCSCAEKPAEPALRPGWQWNEGDKRWDHKGINATAYQSRARTWVAIKWGGRAEPGHPTLEAAMIRAEALAKGEP